jgi:U4/U6.U5 tri-snRNP-associated protein 2
MSAPSANGDFVKGESPLLTRAAAEEAAAAESDKADGDKVDMVVTPSPTTTCPYLDTIQRSVLDFDLEPVCGVSLETGPHIYSCLICGAYLRGRGPRTAAYTHAVHRHHSVYLHLHTNRFYCLPENYEIVDASLEDIQRNVRPVFTPDDAARLTGQNQHQPNTFTARDLVGKPYLPGYVGLNPTSRLGGGGGSGCINSVVQALAHVPPIRDYFLLRREESMSDSSIVGGDGSSTHAVTREFGALVRQLWSPYRFKAHVDPLRLVNAVAAATSTTTLTTATAAGNASNTIRSSSNAKQEAGEFLAWFLHQLHASSKISTRDIDDNANGNKRHRRKKHKASTSIIQQTFQGRVRVTTRQAVAQLIGQREEEDDRVGSDEDDNNSNRVERPSSPIENKMQMQETVVETNFLQLTLDITEKPLFRDQDGGLVIPQDSLRDVLRKKLGGGYVDATAGGTGGGSRMVRRKYELLQLPNYLILHLARFQRNAYGQRVKNPTIVLSPLKNLDLSEYIPSLPTEDTIRNTLSVRFAIVCVIIELSVNYSRDGDRISRRSLCQLHRGPSHFVMHLYLSFGVFGLFFAYPRF